LVTNYPIEAGDESPRDCAFKWRPHRCGQWRSYFV